MASKGLMKNKVVKVAPKGVASLTTYNQAPRKVRLVATLVKGKTVPKALAELSFLPKRAADPIKKLVASAAANAKQKGENPETLKITAFRVDSAGMIVKYMPRAHGRATPIRRRRSKLVVELG